MFLLCITGLLIGSFSAVLATPTNRTEKQGKIYIFDSDLVGECK